MIIADGLALTSYTRDVYDDGWIGGDTTLHILVYEPFRSVSVALWIPSEWSPRSVLFASGTWRREIELAPGVLTAVSVPCTPSPGGVTLRMSIPDAARAASPDQRILGAILHALTGEGAAAAGVRA